MTKYFFLIIAVVLGELYLLFTLAEYLGAANTVVLVILSALVGFSVARLEGFRLLQSWAQAAVSRQPPADGALSGLLVVVGGILLIIPGVLTDLLGALLLIPYTRRKIAARLGRHFEKKFQPQDFSPGPKRAGRISGPSSRTHETDAELVDPPDKPI